jgi:glycosyltransferase involved in cell wall biosynthesis
LENSPENKDKLYIVVPCYNEQAVLPETCSRLTAKLAALEQAGKVADSSRILFVDDGSSDGTWGLIESFHAQDARVSGLKLSRNRGHQNALLAGLMTAKDNADMAVSLDADLQDDIDAIDKFIDEYHAGNEIVYGVRSSRKTDTFFKRKSAQFFYSLMNFMGADIINNHADFRLMSARALDALSQFGETNLFLRGIVPMIGYKYAIVYYERHERFAGESKYSLGKMISFANEGIFSFSIKPIKMITSLGLIVFTVSIAMLIYTLISHAMGVTVQGWSSILCSVWAIGGLQLLAIGVIGEYIGKIYLETKARPKYIIEKFLNEK